MNATRAGLTVTLDQAEVNFSELVRQAPAGHRITITQHGRAIVRLVAVELSAGRRIGAMKSKILIPDDLDAPLPVDTLEA